MHSGLSTPKANNLIPFGFKPFAVILIFILLTLLGILVSPQLSVKLYPEPKGKGLFIWYYMWGSKPEVVEMEATAPLESVISLVDGVKRVKSESGLGWGEITAEIKKGVDPDKVRRDVVATIREVFPNLKNTISYPQISFNNQSDRQKRQLLVYTLSADVPTWKLKDYSEKKLIPQLLKINGVETAFIQGATDREIKINLNPSLANRYEITPVSIIDDLSKYSSTTGFGSVYINNNQKYNITLCYPKIEYKEFGEIPIKLVGDRMLKLGDISTFDIADRKEDKIFRINGKPSVYLIINSNQFANQISVANNVYRYVNSFQCESSEINFRKIYDSTDQIRIDLRRNLLRILISLIILLLFVYLVYQSFKYVGVVLLALIVNLSIAALIYYLLKIEIHLYSLSGIALSLGLIIDNTLVTIDHIRNKGNIKIFTSLLASTLTTIAAISTIFFMKDEELSNLKEFAWVIIINLSISIFIALFLIPSLYNEPNTEINFGKRKRAILKLKFKSLIIRSTLFITRYKKIIFISGILLIGTPIFLLPQKLDGDGLWVSLYNKTLGSETYQHNLKPFINIIFGGTLRLFYESTWENHTWTIPERTRLFVRFTMPQGSTLEQADEIAKIFESQILSFDGVENLETNVYSKRGVLTIQFTKEFEATSLPYELKAKLEQLSITQAAADFLIYGVGIGYSNSVSSSFANSIIRMKGYSHKMLMAYAKRFADSLQKNPRVKDVWIRGGESWVFDDEYRFYSHLNPERLSSLNVNSLKTFKSIRALSNNNEENGWVIVDDKTANVLVKIQSPLLTDIELNQLTVTVDSTSVRYVSITDFEKRMLGGNIFKEDQEYLVTLAYNFIGPDKLVEKNLKNMQKKIKSVLPVGFKAEIPYGNWNWMRDIWSYYLIVVMFLILFIIMATLFESMKLPLAVLIIIPLSFIGVFLTYWYIEISFDQGTFASFLLLGGLVVNSAIYVLNEKNSITKNNSSNELNLYIKALMHKLPPIILTVLSSILGLLPFVLFGEEPFWYSLAVGTIGGLLFSIPALIIFLPVMPGVINNKKR